MNKSTTEHYGVYVRILRVYVLVLSKAIFEMHKASILPSKGKTFDMKMISFMILNVSVKIILTLIP